MLAKKGLAVSPSPTLVIDSKAKEMKSQGIDVISFGAGEPDFDTPVHIREAAIAAIHEGHTRYTPAAGTQELKAAICRKLERENGLHYSPAQIVVSNGAKHSLSNIFTAILNPGDEVMIPVPYWVSYPELVKLNDGIPVPVETLEANAFKVTIPDLKKAWSPKSKALVLNSPSNPTGQIYSKEELEMIGYFCYEHEIFIIADEIYEKLIYGDIQSPSIASLGEYIKKWSIIVNGVSKSYAMTGWRIGYTASSLEVAKVMAAIQSHATSNPNSIAQKAAIAALDGSQDCVAEMVKAFDERRKFMFKRITGMPYLTALEPQGAFYVFVNMAGVIGKTFEGEVVQSSDDFAAKLLDSQKVAVVPGTGFGAPLYFRLSYATSMDNIVAGLERIDAFLQKLA
jgi:aspartate aminotransferase